MLLLAWPGSLRAQGGQGLDEPVRVPQGDPASPLAADAEYEAEWLAVLPPSLIGVDGSIASPVEEQLVRSGRAVGYRPRPRADVAAAVQRIGLGRIANPADLWRVTYASGAHAGVHVRVWAQEGHYVLELTVALLDGRGPFVVRRATDHVAFLETLDGMMRGALPASGTGTPRPAPRTQPRRPPPGVFDPNAFEPEREGRDETPAAPLRRLGLALTTDAAIGLGQEGFYNHLVGARLDVRLTHEVVLGAYLGYANLAGYQGRANNVLSYFQIEDRVRVSDRNKLRIPLRFAAGYLPKNGPVLRMAAGIAYPTSDRFEWGLDLLAPMIWFLPGGEVATSLNLGVEMIFNP